MNYLQQEFEIEEQKTQDFLSKLNKYKKVAFFVLDDRFQNK